MGVTLILAGGLIAMAAVAIGLGVSGHQKLDAALKSLGSGLSSIE
jgi:hypothetical protein